ncbi:Prostaglandin reductase 1 [Folsomia candida]|uniref:15-oxoprostaglandin 13-reductase n=2 Tax=Folsomia candida TaxID=158441 RepID=A0A226EPQ1_FOLCA|nr:Prostaglandin reductase 1 [Folsomia candida]
MTICNPDKLKGLFRGVFPMPDLQGLPDSYALGVCGLTGLAAYFGLLKICQPKSGETVVISSAAGGTGSVAGQIAKIKGCKVIGFAGSEEKVRWLLDLGFDQSFNYKEINVDHTLKKWAVEGVNCYFDNVGGDLTFWVLQNTNESGRVALCGAISSYNDDPKTAKVQFDYTSMIYKQIKMEGFLVNRWFPEWGPAIGELIGWVKDGRVKSRETVVEGFESLPQAFIDIFEGKNVGKMIVAV